jgi:hypothetical protein
MIPADLASRLRLVSQELPTPVQPATPAKHISDALSDLSAGQRIMAEIQALLPNGMYRAVVAQRELTLALPFSAKAGDSLELEVVENDGKLALALVSSGEGKNTGSNQTESASTTLSKTGSLIGNLLGDIDNNQGGKAGPAPLNANHPLVSSFPEHPADIAPILKEALSKSGMFYEAHQARWVEGNMSTASLLNEPQGKLSPLLVAPTNSPSPLASSNEITSTQLPQAKNIDARETVKADYENMPSRNDRVQNDPQVHRLPENAQQQPLSSGSNSIHSSLTPLVQQQLNALATQNYLWQGKIWPGQEMRWEISDEGRRSTQTEESDLHRWKTSLRLDLPQLGNIDAELRMDANNQIQLSIKAGNEESRKDLQNAVTLLDQSMQAAGLKLSGVNIAKTDDNPS